MMCSHYCGQLNESPGGQEITLYGWVHRRRDHGGVIFLDTCNREGLARVVFDPDHTETFAKVDRIHSGFVAKITGKICLRLEDTRNPNMISGFVEVLGYEPEMLNQAEAPSFPLDEYSDAGEEARSRYRFIDLRRPKMVTKLELRARITSSIRCYLDDNGFLDVETPILGWLIPEGTYDYLVPSRTYPGYFFALPQSPRLFKQLLMAVGFDHYHQIAKYFRDEDLRTDRQPEFTQVGIETSSLDENDIIGITKKMVRQLFEEVLDVGFSEFSHTPFEEAIRRYSSDKSDLRIPLKLMDVADQLKKVEFKVFSGLANGPKGRIAALHVPGAAPIPRSQIDDYTKFVDIYGARNLAYIRVNGHVKDAGGLQSPIAEFTPKANPNVIPNRAGTIDGDIVFFGADKAKIVCDALGALRIKVGHDLKPLTREWMPMWVVSFLMFKKNNDDSLSALHHPFTSPKCTPTELEVNPGAALSRAYDTVLNGTELGGGSICIHDESMQQMISRVLGIDEAEQEEKFGFLLDALKYSASPHGGLAFGLDRLIMLTTSVSSVREVIALPKTQGTGDAMTQAPGFVDGKALRKLCICLHGQLKAE